MNICDFFNNHEFIAWCSLWFLWAIIPLAHAVLILVNRTYRTINILCRGWPPEHLDADGDFVKSEVKLT